jgi:hypothetical protein
LDVDLIQQAESKSREEDPARPLRERSKIGVEDVGAHMVRLGIKERITTRIMSSLATEI